MRDEERAELEAMRAREAEWEAHLEEQEQRMREAEEQHWQHQQEAQQMRQQWEDMKGQVDSIPISISFSECAQGLS